MKKSIIYLIFFIILIGIIIFIFLGTPKKSTGKSNSNVSSNSNISSNSNSNEIVEDKKTIDIDYSMYQQLRSEVYENKDFIILISTSNDKDNVNSTFRKEILYSLKDKKTRVYEIDVSKLTKVEYSGIIDDVTKLNKSKEPSIVIPTLLLSKKGKIVYVQEGLAYSTDLVEIFKKQEIE